MTSMLAVHGGAPVRTDPFPAWPVSDDASVRAVADVVESGQWYRVGGTEVDRFERRFAELQQARFAACLTSGTTALDTALRAVGVGHGDEVIVPPYSFIASVMSILYVGAAPAFVDVDPSTHLMDPEQLERAITPRTKAIMPVHIAGRPCDMDAVGRVAAEHGLAVVEDAAQAVGAEWRGRPVGAIGDIGAFSFQNSKNITAGEGGALVTDDEELADRAYSLANVGRVRSGGWYQHATLGYNLRLTELQGALLNRQLDLHAARQALRQRHALLLDGLLADIDGVVVAPSDDRITAHGVHLVLARIPAAAGRKDAVLRALHAEGIPVGGGYPEGLHRNAAVIAAAKRNTPHHPPFDCPGADLVTADTIVLAHHNLLGSDQDVREIAEAFAKVVEHIDEL